MKDQCESVDFDRKNTFMLSKPFKPKCLYPIKPKKVSKVRNMLILMILEKSVLNQSQREPKHENIQYSFGRDWKNLKSAKKGGFHWFYSLNDFNDWV